MNILITGGLGYIGGRVASYLKEKEPGTNIILTTRSKGRELPLWTKNFTILEMNVLEEDSIFNCLKGNNIDIIIHLAALNEIESMKDPKFALEVNTQGTYRLLNSAYQNNINKFIYFSTIHVYGKVTDSIITEETPTKPFHPYAVTHRVAEDFVNYFKHYQNIKSLIFRLSNGYGYPMDKGVNRWTLLFNDLCKQAIIKRRIVLRSSGKQFRDFISLYDVARAVHHFIFLVPDKWENELYNLGGNCCLSILDIAERVSNIFRKYFGGPLLQIEVKLDDRSGGDIEENSFIYSINKLLETGFELRGKMDTEIFKTLMLCKEFLDEGASNV